jgi:hypothetical protein
LSEQVTAMRKCMDEVSAARTKRINDGMAPTYFG